MVSLACLPVALLSDADVTGTTTVLAVLTSVFQVARLHRSLTGMPSSFMLVRSLRSPRSFEIF